jgi:hypothetical protein
MKTKLINNNFEIGLSVQKLMNHEKHCNLLYADSLLGNETHEEDVSDVEGCFELQCNQVFIGMVTMQYQAQIDMVCIVCYPYCTILLLNLRSNTVFQSIVHKNIFTGSADRTVGTSMYSICSLQ